MKDHIIAKIEAELGDRTNRFTLWHDGGEWIVSLEGKPENSKTLAELVGDDKCCKHPHKYKIANDVRWYCPDGCGYFYP